MKHIYFLLALIVLSSNTLLATSCPDPIINTINPSSGPANTLITINGSNFSTTSQITIDGISATYNIIDNTHIEVFIPTGTNGLSDLIINTSGGCSTTAATQINVLDSSCNTSEIYISEIYDSEPGSYGVIELYNPSNTTVTLDGIYDIERYGDIGNATPSITVPLVNSIGPQQTYILQMGSNGNTCSVSADESVGSGFNDNDEFKLLKNGVVIDVVEALNERGYSFIRNPNAIAPISIFNASDWSISGTEDCSDLDNHTANFNSSNPTITHPNSQTICDNSNISFTTNVDTGSYTYQWFSLNSVGVWVPLNNDSTFSGVNTNTLSITNATVSLDNSQYYCQMVSADCNLYSNTAQLYILNPQVDTISDQTVCQDYTLPTLTNGNYFSGANGSGTMLNAGDIISTSQTIYIYNEIGTAPNTCSNESSFTVTVSGNPQVDTISDQTVCQDYTLPTLTNGNYFSGANGSGTMLNAGDVISTSQTIYIYNEIGTAPNTCSNESSFTVTISGNPPVDTISDQTVCQDYTLPTLTNGNYFSGANGSGTMLNAGDIISTSQTIYIYNEIGTAPNTCSNESSFTVTVSGNPQVDTISDQTVCQDYTLPTLTNGNYFSGANGSGTMLNAGDVISTSQTIYIYNEIGTAPNTCSNESSFTVTVSGNPPVDTISDQTVCQDYTLPTLTNGNYFSGANGSGTMLNAGDVISTSQTIYIYNEIGTAPNTCSNESSFTVTISGNPPVDTISDQTVCQVYTLPTLTNGNYFSGANGSGTMLNAGDVISTSQTIYIYNEIGTAPNTCSNESSFTVTVSGNPPVDTISDQTVCQDYTLPILTNGNYFSGANGSGTMLNAGDIISTSQTIYIYNEVGTAPNTCSNESSFTVTISGNPPVDTISDQTVCQDYTLPTLTNGSYFTGSNGSGTTLNAGDIISTSQTIYIYNEVGTAPNTCSNESSFTVTVLNIDFTLDQNNISIIEDTITVSMSDNSIFYEYSLDNITYQNSNIFSNLSNGTYTLFVRDINGCVVRQLNFDVNVSVVNELFIPKYFTPNGDAYNQVWQIIDPNQIIKEIYIFDRYGKLLKQVSTVHLSWNGMYNGNVLPTNDYWYLINLKSGEQLKGHFTLKR